MSGVSISALFLFVTCLLVASGGHANEESDSARLAAVSQRLDDLAATIGTATEALEPRVKAVTLAMTLRKGELSSGEIDQIGKRISRVSDPRVQEIGTELARISDGVDGVAPDSLSRLLPLMERRLEELETELRAILARNEHALTELERILLGDENDNSSDPSTSGVGEGPPTDCSWCWTRSTEWWSSPDAIVARIKDAESAWCERQLETARSLLADPGSNRKAQAMLAAATARDVLHTGCVDYAAEFESIRKTAESRLPLDMRVQFRLTAPALLSDHPFWDDGEVERLKALGGLDLVITDCSRRLIEYEAPLTAFVQVAIAYRHGLTPAESVHERLQEVSELTRNVLDNCGTLMPMHATLWRNSITNLDRGALRLHEERNGVVPAAIRRGTETAHESGGVQVVPDGGPRTGCGRSSAGWRRRDCSGHGHQPNDCGPLVLSHSPGRAQVQPNDGHRGRGQRQSSAQVQDKRRFFRYVRSSRSNRGPLLQDRQQFRRALQSRPDYGGSATAGQRWAHWHCHSLGGHSGKRGVPGIGLAMVERARSWAACSLHAATRAEKLTPRAWRLCWFLITRRHWMHVRNPSE